MVEERSQAIEASL